jgi:hypothetical protein
MFRFTRKPSSGSHRQYLAKITHLVQCGNAELVQDVISVMAAYYDCNKTISMEYVNKENAKY